MSERDQPFTAYEIYTALRIMGVGEDEAQAAANDAVAPRLPNAPERESPAQGIDFSNVSGTQFVGDFLDILSDVSDATRKKVEAYRRRIDGA